MFLKSLIVKVSGEKIMDKFEKWVYYEYLKYHKGGDAYNITTE